MSFLPGMSAVAGAAAKAKPPFSLDFLADNGTGTGSTATTQSSTLSFGAVAPAGETRYIVVVGSVIGSATINSVTIGGVTATIVAEGNDANTHAFVAIAAVPAGTSGSVQITLSDTSDVDSGLATYRLMNPKSATPFDTASQAAAGANSVTISLDTVAGGGAVGVAAGLNTATITWTGLTEDFENDVSGSNERCTGAHLSPTTAAAPLSVTAGAASSADLAGASASWEPM